MKYSKLFMLSILLAATTDAFSESHVAVGSYTDIKDHTPHLFSYTTTDSGNSWSPSVTPPPLDTALNHTIEHVTCDQSGKRCIAVGYKDIKPRGPDPFHALSYFSTDGGETWSNSNITPPKDATNSFLKSVTCDKSAQHCVAVGATTLPCGQYLKCTYPLSYTTSDAGKNWVLSEIPSLRSHDLHSVACGSDGKNCTAVGAEIELGDPNRTESPAAYTSSDGGKTWTLASAMPAQTSGWACYNLSSVTCDSTGFKCVAVGDIFKAQDDIFPLGYVSTDGGKNWKISANLPGEPTDAVIKKLHSVTCDSTGQKCVTVGSVLEFVGGPFNFRSYPLAFFTTDGGQNWEEASEIIPPMKKQVYDLQSVVCDKQGQRCIATGDKIDVNAQQSEFVSHVSNDGGKTWETPVKQPILKVDSEGLRVSVY